MRRESSTVVVLTGPAGSELLAGLSRSPNLSVVRRAADPQAGRPADATADQLSWEPGARAMREAAKRKSTYVLVADDPLAGVAAAWQAMWEPAAGAEAAADFDAQSGQALAAWRGKQFELPDYYLVLAPPPGSAAGPGFHLGPLRAVRPRRVAVATIAGSGQEAVTLLDSLRSLEHGPWWPPLDRLLDSARDFYAGSLAEIPFPSG